MSSGSSAACPFSTTLVSSTSLYLVIIRLHRCCSARLASRCPKRATRWHCFFPCGHILRLFKINCTAVRLTYHLGQHHISQKLMTMISGPLDIPPRFAEGRIQWKKQGGGVVYTKACATCDVVTKDQQRTIIKVYYPCPIIMHYKAGFYFMMSLRRRLVTQAAAPREIASDLPHRARAISTMEPLIRVAGPGARDMMLARVSSRLCPPYQYRAATGLFLP